MKKIIIKGKILDVITLDEYIRNSGYYNPKFVGIEQGGYVLPLKTRGTDTGPGIYYNPDYICYNIVYPTPDQAYMYSIQNVIDYDNANDIGEIIKNNKLIRDVKNEMLNVNPDNILQLNIGPDDTPEMVALKRAINAKGINLSDYEDRFKQYQNDKRLLTGSSITLRKLVEILVALDMVGELSISDVNGAPNPMGNTITVNLTDGRS